MACSSGGISRSSKIFVIFVPVGPRAAGPGITAGAGLTSTTFSCGFDCVVEPLLSVLAFSVGASVFGFFFRVFRLGHRCGLELSRLLRWLLRYARFLSVCINLFRRCSRFRRVLRLFLLRRGRWFYLGWLFKRFRRYIRFLPSASSFSRDGTAFGFSSGFFASGVGAGFASAALSGDFGGMTGVLPSASAFSVGAAAFGFSSCFFCAGVGATFTSAAFSDGFGCVTGVLFFAALSGVFAGASRFLPISLSGSSFPAVCLSHCRANGNPAPLFPSYHR